VASIFICSSLGEIGGALRYTWDLLRILRSSGLDCELLLTREPRAVWVQRLAELDVAWSLLSAEADVDSCHRRRSCPAAS
jgi:hypothetical protein